MIAKRPLRSVTNRPSSRPSLLRPPCLPTPTSETLFQDFNHLLACEIGVRGRAARHERVVHYHRGLLADVAMIGAIGPGGVAQDVLEGIRRRAHVQISAQETGAVFVVVLLA